MFKRISAAFILSAVVAVAPAAVDAQQHDHDADQARASSGTMGTTHMMAYMPQRLLSMQESLGLSEGQLSRLQEMADATSEQSHGHMEEMMLRGQGTCDMLSGDSPDWAVYEDRMEAMADGIVSGHVSMMRRAVEARSVLTPDQIETVAAGMQQGMHGGEADPSMMQGGEMQGGGMSGGMMQGGMMQGGMMQGGMMQMMQMMSGMCLGGTG